MIVWKLPYRIQIPMGLSLAVLITALLVTTVTANISARNTRQETIETIDRAVVLLQAQARPMLAADDIWRVFSLLRDTAALIPGTETKNARVAILESGGKCSQPPIQPVWISVCNYLEFPFKVNTPLWLKS